MSNIAFGPPGDPGNFDALKNPEPLRRWDTDYIHEMIQKAMAFMGFTDADAPGLADYYFGKIDEAHGAGWTTYWWDNKLIPNESWRGIPGGQPPSSGGSGSSTGIDGPSGPTAGNPDGWLLTPQNGLLEDDLAYRLSLLCVNVLQPLKDKYPNIVIVSGFRQTNNGIGQHELGEAVDIQIRNQTNTLLFEVADYIRKFLNFDQLVLNFTNIGDGVGWIHVSFSKNVLRGQVLTKDFADTFHDGLFLVDPLTGEAAAQAARDQAASDADIINELQNIQTRTDRLGQASSVIKDALADAAQVDGTAASSSESGGPSTGGSGGAAGGITFQGPGFGLDNVIGMAAPDVRDWAVTTAITQFGFNPSNLHIEFDKQAVWESVNIGGGTLQQASLWVFIKINGQWYTTAAERLRPNQQNKPADKLYSNWIGVSWLFKGRETFFGPMTGYTPKVGERVGFMVTQGSERLDSNWIVQERSDVLWVTWPQNGKAVVFP